MWKTLCDEALDDVLVQAVITDPPGKEHSCQNQSELSIIDRFIGNILKGLDGKELLPRDTIHPSSVQMRVLS